MQIPGGQANIKADEERFSCERGQLEEEYTLVVPKFGRVVFSADLEAFDKEFKHFEQNLDIHHQSVLADFERRLVNEFLPRRQEHPQVNFDQRNLAPIA